MYGNVKYDRKHQGNRVRREFPKKLNRRRLLRQPMDLEEKKTLARAAKIKVFPN